MSEHPLRIYARAQSLALADIAASAGTSRMTLHRIIRGGNTTVALLKRVSAATGGAVSVEELISTPPQVRSEPTDGIGSGADVGEGECKGGHHQVDHRRSETGRPVPSTAVSAREVGR